MMNQINNMVVDQDYDGLTVKHLTQNDRFEILSISLEAGTDFPEHTSPRQAVLVMLEGMIDFKIDNSVFRLKGHQSISFLPDVKHSVRALENAKFLIVR